jgi:flagellar basal-body rod protein FlgF
MKLATVNMFAPRSSGGIRKITLNSGIYTAFSGLKAQLDALEILANNIANLNTTGFKGEKAFFTYLNQSLQTSQDSVDMSATINRSVLARGALDTSAGSLLSTNRDLDVAIEGNGFLVVETPRGIRYTRNGNLQLNAQSILTTFDGYPVLGTNGRPIALGSGKIRINTDGEVALEDVPVDRLKVVAFEDVSMLAKEGGSLFVFRGEAGSEKAANAAVKSGYLEQSNVNPVSSIVQMVNILRHFEAIQKSVSLEMNDINAKAIEKLGH